MQFDSYRWQDLVQNRYRRSIDLTLTGVFAIALWTGATLQFLDTHGLTPAAGQPAAQTALASTLPDCDA